ncbi:MAG: ORF6N domain-containing protein [Bacteroidales bacterium]|nr:ORF6N domain-containing protein [Bacteroidales bacterium]
MGDELIIIQNLIHEIRGKKVMLDFDLAKLYRVETSEHSYHACFRAS